MSYSVQKALEERKKRNKKAEETSEEKKQNSKSEFDVDSALEARKNRIKNNASSIASNIEERYNSALGSYESYLSDNSSLASATWSEGINLRGVLNEQRERVLAVEKLIRDIEAYRGYLGEDVASKALENLTGMSEGYKGILSNAESLSKFKTQKEYDESIQAQKDYEAMTTFDVEAGKKEIEGILKGDEMTALIKRQAEIKEQMNKLGNQTKGKGFEKRKQLQKELIEVNAQIKELEGQANQKKAYLNKAKYIQGGVKLANDALNAEDFDNNNEYVSTKYDGLSWDKILGNQYGMGYDDLTYEYINNIDGMRDKINHEHSVWDRNDDTSPFEERGLDYVNEDEVKIYNYYYATEGKEKAEKFLDSIQESLNYRKATGDFKEIEGKTFKELLFGAEAGLDQFASGMQNIFNTSDDYIPSTATQMASGMVREDLADNGFKVLGSSVGQIGYDLINTTSNMLPSILTSTAISVLNPVAGQIVGAGVMGASASGNAYAEMLNLGYDKGQARLYSGLVGASEATLQYLLGGIGKLGGGKLTTEALVKVANNMDNAFARVAIKLGANALGEFTEEYLQEVLNPFFKNITLGTNEEVDLFTTEALYSGILGALSAGILEGGSTISSDIKTTKLGEKVQKIDGGVERLKKLGTTFSADSVAYQIADKVTDETGAYKIGLLLQEAGATLSEQNVSDIVSELTKKGMDESAAKRIARSYQSFLNEEMSLTDEQVEVLEGLDPLADVLKKSIIGRNTSVYQRTREYSDLVKLATEMESTPTTTDTPAQTNSFVPYSNEYVDSVAKEFEAMGMPAEQAQIMARMKPSTPTEGKSSPTEENLVESEYEVSADGKTVNIKTDKIVNVKNIAEVSASGETKLTTDDGMVVKASDLSFGSGAEAIFIENIGKAKVGNNPISTTTANALYHAAMTSLKNDPKMSTDKADSLIRGLIESYIYGTYNLGRSKLTTRNADGTARLFAGELSQEQRKFAYELGAKDSVSKAEADQKVIDELVEKAKPKASNKSIGKVIFEKGAEVDESTLTPTQKANLDGIKLLAKISSVEFHVFRSDKVGKSFKYTMPDGTVVGANGWFVAGTNQIWIDLNAGNAGEGTMIRTAAHEISHYIKQWSQQKWKAMADLLMETFAKNGVDTESMLNRQIAKIKRRYKANKKAMPSQTKLLDMAYEELVCDALSDMLTDGSIVNFIAEVKAKDMSLAKKILNAIKNLLKNWGLIIDDYKDRELDTDEAQALSQFEDVFKQLQEMYQDAFMHANEVVATLMAEGSDATGNTDIDGAEGDHLLSDRSMVEGAGLKFIPTKMDGKRVLEYRVEDADGNAVTEVDAEMIQDSPLGNLVTAAVDGGYISDADAEIQYEFLAELVNMCLQYKGIAPVWETAGTLVFSAIKNNADKQYGKTIDFSTVCKKTQAIVDAMSEAMLRLGRGLTRAEVETIYLEVGKAGEETPCPVCYVFSRWMGIGGILDQMSRFQNKYVSMKDADIRAFMEDIEDRIEKRANTPNKKGELKAGFFDKDGNIKQGQVIADLKGKASSKAASALKALAKNSDIKLQIQELEALAKTQDDKGKKATLKKINSLNKKLVDVSEAEAIMKQSNDEVELFEAYQWLTRTLMVKDANGNWVRNKDFKSVPMEVLFDLNKGDEFASGYPLSWAFRTGKGASAGKAIVPYADARVGETIQGIAKSDIKDIKVGFDLNPFLNGDRKTQANLLETARLKQKRQNLIGGQRYQSTSDFRYEYGSDYLITFLEMQAIGAKVQLYTKVIEAVDFLATVGAECNLSVMPLSDGFITLEDGTKKLVYSSVTGINGKAAIEKTHQYNNVQLILVGISDEHIRLALNGDEVTFVIPFHGSGNSVHQIQALMNLLGENLDVTTAQDYTPVQSDHHLKKKTQAQKDAWNLRKKIIMGKAGTLTANEHRVLKENEFLDDMYRRFYEDESAEEYGVALTEDQANQIFPYEYWDKSLTYDQADQNGERFKQYCETLGIVPRFSGVDSDGKQLGFGDFTNTKGYWKLLIDRRMYENVYDADGNWVGYGKYHHPQTIDVTNFKAETIDPAWGTAHYGEVMAKSNDPKKTNKIVDAAIAQFENKGETMLSDRDDANRADQFFYDALISKPDMKVTILDGKIPNNRADVVHQAKKNAASVGKTNKNGSVSVYVDDVGRDVVLATKGLLHGLRRISRIQTDPNFIVTLKAGEIIKNSIKINELTPSKGNASGSYVLIGAAKNTNGDMYIVRSVVNQFNNELDSMDILYAINAKKEELAATKSPRLTAKPLSVTSSIISIAELLNYVNEYFPDVLPESAWKHYGHIERPKGELGESVLFSERDIDPITEADYKNLEKHFGTTGNFNVAGYLLTDGKLLDFSGKHWGDTYSKSRQVDHRDIQEVIGNRDSNNGVNAMIDMIGNGNIRLMPEIGGINLAVYPNEKQRRVLSTYINYMLNTEGEVVIDYDAVGGDTVYSKTYGKTATSRQILNDIRNYFNGARQSELMQFHTMYSERDQETADKVISNLRSQAVGSRLLYGYATYTEERMEREIRTSSAQGIPDYAKSYITWVNPTDFIYATTTSEQYREQLKKEAGSLDIERLKKETQPIHLTVNFETGEIVGHEGRHRMLALQAEGVDKVVVIIDALNDDRHHTKPIEFMRLKGQRFGRYSNGTDMYLHNMLPLSERYADTARKLFTSKPKSDIQFSERGTSNRGILANALESVAQNDIERTKLAQYKEKIALIESEEKRLSEIQKQLFTKGGVEPENRKKLQFEAKQIANRINTYDRQLLNLESTSALKNVLNREKQLAMKRQKQKDNEALAKYKEKVAADKRVLLDKYQDSRKKAMENRNKTAMRHKIKKVVGDLNTLLLRPTKERHIPEEMRTAVAEALDLVNMDTVDADARVEKYNELIAKAKDPDVIASLTETRDRIKEQGNKLADKLTKLKEAYDVIQASTDEDLKSIYDDVIYNKIDSVKKKVGKTPIRNMTLEQLESVYELYTMVLTTVRDSNKAFAENIKLTRDALGSNTFGEIKDANLVRDRIKHQAVEKFLWQNLKPMQAMKTIGSGTLQKLWNNILYGQEVFAQDFDEAVKFAKDMKEKYGYDKWDLNKLHSFESKSGKVMKINLEQMMSIYAYSKRHQADEHIEYGGIVLNEGIIKEKNKWGKIVEYKVNDSTAYRLDKKQVEAIIASLEKEAPGAKDFVDEMQKYLSEVMGEKGNEVAMKMYGIRLFKEEHYFPLKSSKDFMEAANAKLKGDVKIKNKGMTKSTVEHARNPIVLENFLDVWGNHINEMALYHGLVLPLEDFSRTLNYGFKADDKANVDAESVRTALHDAFGDNADNYLNNLLKAINGGVLHDSTAGFANKMISKFKKAKVMASLSVIVQQPTAIIRAMGIIEPKYFLAQNFNHKATWEELKKYCPTAIIKEAGSFDTNMGRTIVDMIKDERGFADKVGDVLGKAPAYMDEVGWNMIWRALKNKVATEQKLTGEALLQECGKQMTLILNETQVYDSVMARNELMRSKDGLTKLATSFMAEPTTVINMIYGAALDIKRGYKKMAAKTVAATIGSVVVNGLVSAMVYALRDDEEDETLLEKYLSAATTEVLDGLNPLTYIPFVKDAYSIFQGYKVERADMSLIQDVNDAINGFYNVLDPEAYEDMSKKEIAKHIYDNSVPLLTSICDMFGLPTGNILRDAEALIIWNNTPMSQTTGAGTVDALKDGVLGTLPKIVQKIIGTESKQDKLYDAIVSGDATQINRLKSGYKDDKAYETAVRKALRENDTRVREAAEARMSGDIAEYTRIVKAIKAEGNFSQDTIVASVNAEINAINKGESSTSTSETENKESSIYKMDDYYASIVGGDEASAYVVKEDIINTAIANGKDRDEAETSFSSSFSNYLRNEFEDGNISEYDAQRMLVNYGDKSEKDATSKVQYWAFKQEYPDYDDLSEEAVTKYYDEVESYGISVGVYYDYSKQRAKCKGVDANGDGKTDSGSKKAEILQVINSLPLTYAQKDALYYLNGWSAKTIYEAPWH